MRNVRRTNKHYRFDITLLATSGRSIPDSSCNIVRLNISEPVESVVVCALVCCVHNRQILSQTSVKWSPTRFTYRFAVATARHNETGSITLCSLHRALRNRLLCMRIENFPWLPSRKSIFVSLSTFVHYLIWTLLRSHILHADAVFAVENGTVITHNTH